MNCVQTAQFRVLGFGWLSKLVESSNQKLLGSGLNPGSLASKSMFLTISAERPILLKALSNAPYASLYIRKNERHTKGHINQVSSETDFDQPN